MEKQQEELQGEIKEEENRLQELEDKVRKLEQIARAVNERYMNLQREYELLKERYRKDMEEFVRYGYDRFALDLLEVVDNLERALETQVQDVDVLRQGVQMVYRQLMNVLEKYGIKPMELEGSVFDPTLAEAVEKEFNPDLPPYTILRVVRKGYFLHERVLRPARVVVSYSEEEIT